MKESELRECATCRRCGNKIMSSGVPLFWRVTIERFGIDLQAATRQQGLSMMLGSPVLAMHMGPDEDLAKPVMEKVKVVLCESCCTEPVMIAALAERTEGE